MENKDLENQMRNVSKGLESIIKLATDNLMESQKRVQENGTDEEKKQFAIEFHKSGIAEKLTEIQTTFTKINGGSNNK
jgi:hypothetical protein